VTTLNEALPLVKDPHLAHDIRGFIGQEAMHADVHKQVLHEYLVVNGIDPRPMLDQVEYAFEKVLAPTTSTEPKRRLNHLCDRPWLIAAIEHYTAVLGDFALTCAWRLPCQRNRSTIVGSALWSSRCTRAVPRRC
jgi:predicted metal-dependent hydrolase